MSLVNTTGPGGPPPIPFDPVRAAEDNLGLILGVQSTFHFIALVFVALRIYARVFVVKAFGKDDICIVLSAICALGGWICFVLQGAVGLGKHQETISAADMIVFQHIGFWQSIISAILALAFLKLSIGFGLLRLSTHKWYSAALWATMAIVAAYSVLGLFTFFLHCSPMSAHWDPDIRPQTCYPLPLFITFALVNTSFNIATDVLFATYPVPVVWTLQMPRRTRMYLVGILSLGYFAVAMGILKAYYQLAFSKERDKTFNQHVQFWGFLQLNFGIIAACAATLKPLLNRFLHLGSTAKPSGAGTGGSLHTWGSRSFGQPKHERLETPNGGGGGGTIGKHKSDDLETSLDGTEEYEMDTANTGNRRQQGGVQEQMYPQALYPGNGAVVVRGGAARGSYNDGSSGEMILADGVGMGGGEKGRGGIVVATEFGVKG
ncbi:hypothetical protein QBC47DRAFT_430405 [Echria macrotheca]|uniref:Rhodopsin domain-containing protein n=1 Tax=Echria macrotheca TaxID=438768 RepID=A0AAJ0BAS3_9PEZI|nr:hypothetical protein QBC47DRAFT_430405 [Echria macrotheca]